LVDADNAPGFQTGELVTFIPYFSCGTCIACRTGKPNCCAHLKVCGVHADGGMVECLSVPSSYLLHGADLSADALALVEPLSIGAHGVRRAHIKRDEYALIIGAGPIGLAAIEFAKIEGARVIVLDVNEHRLQFCKSELQIHHTINAPW
jgi:threonine dehydrogenase-like Zn-dependent dehydrogenase